jgi:LCCL domain/EF hand
MRIKLVVLTVLLGSAAFFGLVALLPEASPGHAQHPAVSPAEREAISRPQPSPVFIQRPVPVGDTPDQWFLSLDRNGDGLLDYDEMPDSLRDERAKWDTNGDGYIDLAEWKAYLAAVSDQANRMARRNAISTLQNPDQAPEVREPRRPVQGGGQPKSPPGSSARPPFKENPTEKAADPPRRFPKNLPAWFREYDTDGDGQVGLYEWKAKKEDPQEFEKYDLNRDGYITVEELVRSGQFLTNTRQPQTIHGLGSQVGDYYYFELTGTTNGIVWGDKVYTGDSFLAATAVHAGILKVGETGFVKVTILAGRDKYEGTEQNGVSSQAFGMYPKSFSIEAIK